MARQKRTSKVVDRAETRASSLAAISKDLDLGNNLTLAGYTKEIDGVRALLDEYNSLLSRADGLALTVREGEKKLSTLTSRMLIGVAAKYGDDSHEYEMAGGVRRSARDTSRK